MRLPQHLKGQFPAVKAEKGWHSFKRCVFKLRGAEKAAVLQGKLENQLIHGAGCGFSQFGFPYTPGEAAVVFAADEEIHGYAKGLGY